MPTFLLGFEKSIIIERYNSKGKKGVTIESIISVLNHRKNSKWLQICEKNEQDHTQILQISEQKIKEVV